MLRDGRLQALAWGGTPLRSNYAYWLLVADGAAGEKPREDVARVADWIREEAGRPVKPAG